VDPRGPSDGDDPGGISALHLIDSLPYARCPLSSATCHTPYALPLCYTPSALFLKVAKHSAGSIELFKAKYTDMDITEVELPSHAGLLLPG
jgi:hypothetical protein